MESSPYQYYTLGVVPGTFWKIFGVNYWTNFMTFVMICMIPWQSSVIVIAIQIPHNISESVSTEITTNPLLAKVF